jgi:hypothetical protein
MKIQFRASIALLNIALNSWGNQLVEKFRGQLIRNVSEKKKKINGHSAKSEWLDW